MGQPHACPAGGERPLTQGEVALARSIFGTAIAYEDVRLRRRKWFAFQPSTITMAPRGHIHFHPKGSAYCDDFAKATLSSQAHFIHEMTHVWQSQSRGSWYLPIHRHPWCRYDYSIKPGWKLEQYGIEQQAMIVQHAFELRNGRRVTGVADKAAYDALVDFPGAERGKIYPSGLLTDKQSTSG